MNDRSFIASTAHMDGMKKPSTQQKKVLRLKCVVCIFDTRFAGSGYHASEHSEHKGITLIIQFYCRNVKKVNVLGWELDYT
jgi:hypothetical protein